MIGYGILVFITSKEFKNGECSCFYCNKKIQIFEEVSSFYELPKL